jgi:hypothetical protein
MPGTVFLVPNPVAHGADREDDRQYQGLLPRLRDFYRTSAFWDLHQYRWHVSDTLHRCGLALGGTPSPTLSCPVRSARMDPNSGEPWSEMDISDLTHSLDYGDTFAQTASFLCRGEDEVRCLFQMTK